MSSYSLSKIIAPVSVEEFFDAFWEKQPLVVERDDPDYFASLISREEIDRVVATLHLEYPDISLTNAAREISKEDYTFASGMIDVARLYQEFGNGATIILPQLGLRVPTLANLCRSMEAEMSTRFQTNIYLTPPNAQGFKPHYDSHDVFVLQVAGEKHWKIYNTAVELPYRRQEFHPDAFETGEVSMEFDLKPGDVLYLPRGIMHAADTVGKDVSLHVTLGALFTSWTDLILESIARVGLADSRFRRGLPVGFAGDDFDRETARGYFRELISSIAEHADFDAALDHFRDDLIATRHPLLLGQMEQIEKLGEVTIESRAGVRDNLLYRLEVTDSHALVHCYGSVISFPKHVEAPLRFALKERDFAIGDLPGSLDQAGKLVLIKRLVHEGMAQIHR